VLGHAHLLGTTSYRRKLEKVVQKLLFTWIQTINSYGQELSSAQIAWLILNNNISKCFNNWIKDYKSFPLDILMDTIRGQIRKKIATRQQIDVRLIGRILPSVINELNIKSRSLKYTIKGSNGLKAEVFGLTRDNAHWRHGVDLDNRTYSCDQW
jgi:hypothetical protein